MMNDIARGLFAGTLLGGIFGICYLLIQIRVLLVTIANNLLLALGG